MKTKIADNLYGYDNYRSFLKDYFNHQKKMRASFSHRFFAQRAGFSSSSFCSHVIDGKRNLTEKSLRKMIRGLKLAGRAEQYFTALVNFNQAKTVEDRETYFTQLERLRKSSRFYRLHQKQYAYYDEWYYPVIRELVVHSEWNGDFALLGRLVQPVITPDKARRAVDALLETGLISKDVKGVFYQSSEVVSAADVPSAITRKSRKELILRAIDAAEKLPVDARHIAGATVAMSEKSYRRAIERFDELRRQLLLDAMEDPEVERVYQFNIQAFPLSRHLGEGKK